MSSSNNYMSSGGVNGLSRHRYETMVRRSSFVPVGVMDTQLGVVLCCSSFGPVRPLYPVERTQMV